MFEGDIRHFFRPSPNSISSSPRGKKRSYELPLEKPFLDYFPLMKPIPASEPMVENRRAKRLEESAVKAKLKVRTKLEIMQWHFSQENPNRVVTAQKFFPEEPVKTRTVQN